MIIYFLVIRETTPCSLLLCGGGELEDLTNMLWNTSELHGPLDMSFGKGYADNIFHMDSY